MHKVLVDKWSHAEVGIKFKVTRFVVGNIIRRIKLDGGYLESIQADENTKLIK